MPGNLVGIRRATKLPISVAIKLKFLDLTDLSVQTLTAEQRGMSGLRWLNDGTLVFNWTKSAENDSGLSKRVIKRLEDRWSSFRNVSQFIH